MKKIKYLFYFLPAIVLLSLAFCFKGQSKSKDDEQIAPALVEILESYHYEPKAVNDAFSKVFFVEYIKKLDAGKRFFIQPNITELAKYETDIDNQLKNGQYEYFENVNKIHAEKIIVIENWYKEILKSKFDFNAKEFLEINEDSASFFNTDIELKAYWVKFLKQQTLEKLARKLDVQEKAQSRKDTVFKIKSFDTLELESRNEVLKTQNDWTERLKKFDRKDRLTMYHNTLTEIFDLHTNYFPPQDKENFDIRMSGKLEGIGAQLQEKDGLIKVMNIVPGSPSYKQGQLKAGYFIIKVAQGNGEAVDVTNMKMDDAIQLIRGKKGTEVRLTVKKPDESIMVIPIIRDVVVMEDSYAKSLIIEDERIKYGYINLPSFYLDMNDRNGRSCSRDVKEEIEKLKADGVKGIILDLRDNGGGSLSDVVDIGGFFIDKGPITLVKSRGKKPEILADKESGVLWDGPLTIMVNENSASASEILAAAMQDYKRAIIIGSSTYGKGTVQRFVDLDDMFQQMINSGKAGSLKITIQKFYRINGSTTQKLGVIPDVIIPDRYKYLSYGEKESKFALEADKIAAADYKIDKTNQKKIEKAKEKSDKRIKSSDIFNEIEQVALKVKAQSNKTKFTLNLAEYREEMRKNEVDNKKYEELYKKIKPFVMLNAKQDNDIMGTDSLKVKIKKDWNKNFEKDIYIHEALNVLNDLN